MSATKIQWERAQAVVKQMFANRGMPVIDTKVDKGVTWIEAAPDPSMPSEGTSAVERGLTRTTAMLSPSSGCVGKSDASKALASMKKRCKGEWPPEIGRFMFVHSSHLSSEGKKQMAKANVQVFSMAELQFDRLSMLQARGLLQNIKIEVGQDPSSSGHLRRWLISDPISRYLGLNVDDVVHYTTKSEPWSAVVVPIPPFAV